MKPSIETLIKEFTNYLITLGYSESVCYNTPNMIEHFVSHVNKPVYKITKQDVTFFFEHLKLKTSERTCKKLSNVHINGYLMAIKRFSKFLFHMHSIDLTVEHLSYLKVDTPEKQILSLQQIKSLFDVCDNTKLGMRDKAMLSLYYSCGLRRNEGISVEIRDIDFANNILFVRNGKGGKQRYVPFTQTTHDILRKYIDVGRKRLNRKNKFRNTLLIGYKGEKLKAQALQLRVNTLCKKAQIKQKMGLHTLRHSIATHLLMQNMSIYKISEFLGHSSLESTQIYTHILENND